MKLRIKALMKEKGINAPFKELRRLGISHAIAHKYMVGTKKWILVEHIAKICLLLRCEPNDLLEWTPDNNFQDDPNQPLQKVKPRSRFDLMEATKNMTPGQLKEMFDNYNKKD